MSQRDAERAASKRASRMFGPPDVVPNVSDDELRALYGPDADHVIAFRRFLALPEDDDGRKLCPPHWYDYALGKIDSAEALRLDGPEVGA